MLPTTSRGRSNYRQQHHQSLLSQYLRRLVKWQQMDFEYTFWQMLHLCTTPRIVYQQTKYHKQTKNQWSRDDPAFTVMCTFFLAVAVMAYCAAYGTSFFQASLTVLTVVIVHFILTGILVASFWWYVCNQYLREEAAMHSHVVEQRVEWLYAFDVHCNAYFPVLVLLYVVQYFISPFLITHGLLPTLISNLFFLIASSYYQYLNFLGYDVLPFLDKTTFFLYPIGIIFVIFIISTLVACNPTRFFLAMYFGSP